MSLNNIQLPSALITDLYAQSLIMDKDAKIMQPAQAIEPVTTNNIAQPENILVSTTPAPTPAPAAAAAKPIPVATATAAPEWKSLGQNAKNILILVNNPGITFLPDDELAFLTQMLQACKLSLADIALLNLQQYQQTAYTDILQQFGSKTVFLFGVEPTQWGLPINFPAFQIQQFDSRKFLHSPGLGEMMGDKLLKTKLWAGLKTIFGL
mgnify:CR=1 FL=1